MPREIIILQRGRGEVLLSDGYQYHRKKIYKNAEYWKCVKTKSTKCVGSVSFYEINDKNNRKISLYALLKKLYKNSPIWQLPYKKRHLKREE